MSDFSGEGDRVLVVPSDDSATVRRSGPSDPVVVLGMHRAGTSLTTRILGDLGWYLGRSEDLLGPREDNPDGFFERADVQVLNDLVLSRVGASWDGPPEPEELHDLGDDVDQQVTSLVASLEQDASGAPFALKDPRLCVLWPLWERHLSPTTRLVLTFRHPAEVAASLQKRDGLPLVTGLALWEDYVRRALAAAEGRNAVLVRYGDLLKRPTEIIERLAAALGVTVPADPARAVRPELYRNRRAGDVPLTASQRELWSWIEHAPMSLAERQLKDVPGAPSESSVELLRVRRHVIKVEAEAALLHRSLEESASELERQASNHRAAEQDLRDARDAERRASEAAMIELAVLRDRVRHHQAVRARQEAQIERDSLRLAELAEERRLLDDHVEVLRQKRLEQTQRIDALNREVEDARALLDRSSEELATLREEKDSCAQIAQSRERVLTHERNQLARALSVVEGERRVLETTLQAVQGSRTWRWGRRLASPVTRGSSRGDRS